MLFELQLTFLFMSYACRGSAVQGRRWCKGQTQQSARRWVSAEEGWWEASWKHGTQQSVGEKNSCPPRAWQLEQRWGLPLVKHQPRSI